MGRNVFDVTRVPSTVSTETSIHTNSKKVLFFKFFFFSFLPPGAHLTTTCGFLPRRTSVDVLPPRSIQSGVGVSPRSSPTGEFDPIHLYVPSGPAWSTTKSLYNSRKCRFWRRARGYMFHRNRSESSFRLINIYRPSTLTWSTWRHPTFPSQSHPPSFLATFVKIWTRVGSRDRVTVTRADPRQYRAPGTQRRCP